MRASLLSLCVVLTACEATELLLPEPPGQGAMSGRLLVAKPGVGEPVPATGALVQLLHTNVRTTSNDAGRFTLTPISIERGAVLVQFEQKADGSYARQRLLNLADYGARPGVDLSVGDILLRENATVRGRALLRDHAQDRTGHRSITVFVPEGPFTGYTGDDGSFSMPGLPEGGITLAFYREGYAPATVGPVTLRPGELFTLGDVLLEPTTEATPKVPVAGRVRCNPELPDLSQARVVVLRGSEETALTVAVDGTFRTELAPGLVSIRYAHEGYGSVTVPNVFIPPAVSGTAEEVRLADVTLSPRQPDPVENHVAPPPTATIVSHPFAATSRRYVLDATGSFGEQGHPLVFSWTQLAGDPVVLERNDAQDAARTGFTAPALPQQLAFQVEVKDTITARAGSAVVSVQVVEPPRITLVAPEVAALERMVTLDASASVSSNPLVFSWRQKRGNAITFTANDSTFAGRTTFLAPATAQEIGIELAVRDSVTNLETVVEHVLRVESAPIARVSSPSLGRTGETFTLDGSDSTGPEGHLLSFSWRQVDGPLVEFDRNDAPGAATTTFRAPSLPRRLTFSLTVRDTVTTLATEATATVDFDDAPIAAIGSPRRAQAGARYELDATSSRGPAGHPILFTWRQTGGATVVLTENASAAASRTSFVAPSQPQVVSFELTVADTRTGFSDTETITIDFEVAPLAVVRAPQKVRAGSSVQLDGSRSIGPDGHALVYSWRQSLGDSVAFSVNDSPDAATPVFQAPARAQMLAFDLTVVDTETQLVATASTVLEVQEAPVARVETAGVARSGGLHRLDGSRSTSAAGAPLLFRWHQTEGDSVVLSANDSALAAAPTFTVPARNQILAFELTVVDMSTGLDSTATVSILVLPPPRAVIDPPAIVVRPGARFRLDGSKSNDPLGTPITAYRWSLLPATTDATLDATNTPSVLVTAGQNPFVVQLVVATTRLDSDPESVSIQLNPNAVVNPSLVLSHGLSTVDTGSTVTVTATTTHPDPTETVTVTWAQVAGSPAPLVVSAPAAGTSSAVIRAPDLFTTLVFDVTARASGGGTVTKSFTLEVVDNNAPRIVHSAPATANGAGPAFYASITFDKDVDPATLLPANLRVTDAEGEDVPADLAYDAASFTARLNYRKPLAPGGRYTLHLEGIRDRTPAHNVIVPVHMPFSAAPARWDLFRDPSAATSSVKPRPWLLYTPTRITVVGDRVSPACPGNTVGGVLWSYDIERPGTLRALDTGSCLGVDHRNGDFGPRGVAAGSTFWAYSYNGPLYQLQADRWLFKTNSCCQFGTDGAELVGLYESFGSNIRVWNPATNAFNPDVRVDSQGGATHRLQIGGDGNVTYIAHVAGANYVLLRRDAAGRWSNQGTFGGPARTDMNFARVRVHKGLPVILGEELAAGAWKVRAWRGVANATGGVTMQQLGGDVNEGSVAQSDGAIVGSTLYVALVEGGQVRVRHADLEAETPVWVNDPGPEGPWLNVNPNCQVDRPTVAGAPDGLWLAWSENCDAINPAWKIYVRQLTSGPVAPAFPAPVGPPTLTRLEPKVVGTGEAVTLDVSALNPDATNALTFAWTQVDGTSVPITTAQTATSTRATLTAPSAFSTLVFKVTATGERGGSDSTLVTVEVQDRTKPRILSSIPASGSGPALSATIVFDEPIAPASIVPEHFVVETADGDPVTVFTRYDSGRRTATVTYARPLTPGASYVLRIAGVLDASPQANEIAPVTIAFDAAAATWSLYAAPEDVLSTVTNRPWIVPAAEGMTVVGTRLDTVACPANGVGTLLNLDLVEPGELRVVEPTGCRAIDHRNGDFGPAAVSAGGQVWAYSYNGALYQRNGGAWAGLGSACCQIASDGASMIMFFESFGLNVRTWNAATGGFNSDVRVDNGAWRVHRMSGGGDGRVFYAAGAGSGGTTSVARRDENGTWARLGAAGGAGASDALVPRVRVHERLPVVVQNESVAGSWKVRAYRGIEGSPWTFPKLGGSDVNTTGSASQSDAAIVGETLYVTWSTGAQVLMRSLDLGDDAATWRDIAGPSGPSLHANAACAVDRPTMETDGSRLYVAWSENCDSLAPKWRVFVRSLR